MACSRTPSGSSATPTSTSRPRSALHRRPGVEALSRRLDAGLGPDGRRHLCGDRFTAADLTFACLAAAVVVPPEYGVRLPRPDDLPEPVRSDVERFREHPAGAYALALFATKRRLSAGGQSVTQSVQ
jgi:glutathione S-transferase